MVSFIIVELVVDVGSVFYIGVDYNREERQCCDNGMLIMNFVEDNGYSFQLYIQNVVDEVCVQCYGKVDRGVQDEDGLYQKFVCKLVKGDLLFFDFGMKGLVVCFMVQFLGFFGEQEWRIVFVNEDDVDEQDGGLDDFCEIFGLLLVE